MGDEGEGWVGRTVTESDEWIFTWVGCGRWEKTALLRVVVSKAEGGGRGELEEVGDVGDFAA